MTMLLYKVVPAGVWRAAQDCGVFSGHGIDLIDGYIHLSSPEQVAETLSRHFSGQDDLMLVSVDGHSLGKSLRWEPSRGGALFPHVYGSIPLTAVIDALPLPLDDEGRHVLP